MDRPTINQESGDVPLSREEKITFLVWAVEQIEGVKLELDYFKHHTDESLDEEVEWLDYLLDK